MISYLVRRILASIPILFGATFIAFVAVLAIPGDPARVIAGSDATPQDIERIRTQLGLNEPIHTQYWKFLTRLSRGDLGRSTRLPRPVATEIGSRLPATLELAAVTIVFATVIGVLLGIVSALKRNSLVDDAAMLVALTGMSIPAFWLGLLLILLFSVQLGWLPPSGRAGPIWTLEGMRSVVLPVLTLSVTPIAYITRLTRSAMLETLTQDYVRTAHSKGLAQLRVLLKHALRNAALPIITFVGMEFGYLLGGIVVVETVFSWPGLGRAVATAVFARDFPLIQGIVLVLAGVFIVVNLVVDIAYGLLDPRIQYGA